MSKHKTAKEVDDQVAADALRYGRKSGPLLTHSAMATTEENPDASATDASDGDDEDWGDRDDKE